MKHKRFRSINLKTCNKDCPKEGGPLKIVLFMRDEYLKSHTVNHLIKKEEESKVWKELFPDISKEIDACREKLQSLGCLWLKFTKSEGKPPCFKKEGKSIRITCKIYESCSEVIKNLEAKYLEIVEKIIREGGNIPRYVCYIIEKDEKIEMLCILSNRRILVYASYHSDENIYNLTTCFVPGSGDSLPETCRDIKRKIENKGLNKPVWCTPESWAPWPGSQLREALEKAGITIREIN